jgi:putative ABC transport system substrate-binding protein
MRRQEFIAELGGAAAWPVVGRAQQPAVPVIGYLITQSADDVRLFTVPFFLGLKEAGYVEGQNVVVEYRNRRINSIGCRRLQPISPAAVLQ